MVHRPLWGTPARMPENAIAALDELDDRGAINSSVGEPQLTQRDHGKRPSWRQLLQDTVSAWMDDKAPRLGAALAFYTVFSLAPLLVLAVSVAGFAFGAEAVQSHLDEQLQGFVGQEGAKAIQSMIVAASQPKSGAIAAVLGIIALLFGASGVFLQMKDALNTIWGVAPKPGLGIWEMIRNQFLSFAMVFGIDFLLLVTLLVSTTLAALTNYIKERIPGLDILAHGLDLGISFVVVTLLFALIFKYLPDVKITWRDVWFGAAVTAVLFTIGKYAIGMYLGRAAVGSAYGAAGSIVIVLLWAYYSSQILFFGAELTKAYARLYGSHVVPAEGALPVTAEMRAKQGMPQSV